jgi:hypothetical protein
MTHSCVDAVWEVRRKTRSRSAGVGGITSSATWQSRLPFGFGDNSASVKVFSRFPLGRYRRFRLSSVGSIGASYTLKR